jgi:hypothetical protein
MAKDTKAQRAIVGRVKLGRAVRLTVRWPLATVCALLVAACAAPAHLQGRWVGTVGAPCPGTALLSTARGEAVFVRDDSAQALRGTVTPDGQVSTSVETRGADKKGFVQTFTGTIRGDAATGTYASPRCASAPVTLRAG